MYYSTALVPRLRSPVVTTAHGCVFMIQLLIGVSSVGSHGGQRGHIGGSVHAETLLSEDAV